MNIYWLNDMFWNDNRHDHKQYFQQLMDDKQKTFTKLAIGVGGLALAYALVNYLANRNSSRLPVSLEKTRKISQQIKYQMYSNLISFAEGVNVKLKSKFSQDDLNIYLRTQAAKLYELKEELIISKHTVSKDEYAASLKHYKKDAVIRKNQEEILNMMERAIKGQIPDLTVPQAALLLLGREEVKDLYKEICTEIAIKVHEKLSEKMQTNPNFNPKDDAHFKKAIREVSIYDFKVDFLERKGYRKEWGCPNEIFFKVLETHKQERPEIKVACYRIEKGYEKLIDKVSNNPEELNRAGILAMMNDHIQQMEKAEAERVQGQQANTQNPQAAQPQAAAPMAAPKRAAMSSSLKPNQPLFGSIKPQAPPNVQANEEDDMEALMMKELLSRSQESPKGNQKTTPTFPAVAVSAAAGGFGETKLEDDGEEEVKVQKEEEGQKQESSMTNSELKKSLGVKHTDSMDDEDVSPSAEQADAFIADVSNEGEKPADATEPVEVLQQSKSCEQPKLAEQSQSEEKNTAVEKPAQEEKLEQPQPEQEVVKENQRTQEAGQEGESKSPEVVQEGEGKSPEVVSAEPESDEKEIDAEKPVESNEGASE